MRLRTIRVAVATLALVGLGLSGSGTAGGEVHLTCERIPQLSAHFLRKHVTHYSLSPELRQRSAQAYLERIDPSKTLLLQAEADELASSLVALFEEARKGECARLSRLNERIVARYQKLEVEVQAVVGQEDFAIDPETELVLDPDERGFPATPQERDALLRRQIQFQLANYMSAGTPLPEAKERLVHRYELFTRRARELGAEDLYAAFLDGFAASLDPHSNYLSADALEDFQIAMTLSLEGIGVALSSRDGYAIVERILPGGAADRAEALQPNDRIIGVAQADGEMVDIIDMALRDVVRLIRGKRGTPVRLLVLREAETAERLQVTIVRDKIDLEEQAAKLSFETVPGKERELKLAVIELTSFYGDRDRSKRQCADDVAALLQEVKREQADGLLLDLSRNGGGLLDYAVEISGLFIGQGPIVAVRDRGGPTQVLEDPHHDVRYAGPLVVLTSRVSASASEILAGALKDYRRAVIVGDDHTFGKGTVQTVIPLGIGLGALKVTTAMFYRPGGVSTQLGGVTSDVTIPSLFNTDRFGEQSQPYALPTQRIAAFTGAHANPDKTEEHWQPVTEELIARLVQGSRTRVAESEAFQAIETELAKREDDGVVRVAEILGDSTPAAGAAGAAPEAQLASAETPPAPAEEAHGTDEEESLPTPQVQEALRILTELVELQTGTPG